MMMCFIRRLRSRLKLERAFADTPLEEMLLSWEWHVMDPETVRVFNTPDPDSVWVLGAASEHRNGYVREAAVRFLAKRQEQAAIGFLLARANDWVRPVRARAKVALLEKVRHKPSDFGSFLPLLDRLGLCGREDHQELVGEVRNALLREEGLHGLRNALESPDRLVRRAAYKIVLSAHDTPIREFVVLGLKDKDTVVRTTAARKIVSSQDLKDLIGALLTDGQASVRRLALDWLSLQVPPDQKRIGHFIFDKNSGIREVARYFVRKNSEADIASIYREALGNEALREVAILGLGEIGAREVIESVRAFLSSDKIPDRRAALIALSKLAEPSEVASFWMALNDSSASVSRAACHALMKREFYLSKAQLWDTFMSTDKAFVKKNFIHIFAKLSKWSALAQLLRATAATHDDLQELCVRLIYVWLERYNRAFVSPTPQDLIEVELNLAAARCVARLPSQAIDALLKAWAPLSKSQ